MPRRAPDGRVPSWDALYETAAAQSGYFTARQGAAAGYSPQLIQYYLRDGRVERWARGIFRIVHFPASEHEELVPTFLWSGGVGVFGRETALAIHNLSDVLPAKQHLFLPTSWSKRRVTAPRRVRLYFVDVPETERTWHGAVLVTTPPRTVRDCIAMHVSPELVDQAIAQGVRRKLFTRADVRARSTRAA